MRGKAITTSITSMEYEKITQLPEVPEKETGRHCWEITYITEGAAECLIDGKQYTLETRRLLLIPPRMRHTWYATAPLKLVRIIFPMDLTHRLALAMPELDAIATMLASHAHAYTFNPTDCRIIGRIILSMENESTPMRGASLVEILARMAVAKNPLLAGTTRHKTLEDERAKKIKSYLAKTPVGEISLDAAAKMVGLGHPAFCIVYKKIFGRTFVSDLQKMRVKEACRLLLKGKLSLEEIAARTGFKSVNYFIRIFKKTKGTTPLKWLKEVD